MSICPNCFAPLRTSGGSCMYCGYRETVPREKRALPLGARLKNRYMIGRVLGAGGFGVTYVAYDMQRQERQAIKEYFPIEWAVRAPNRCTLGPKDEAKAGIYKHGCSEFINEGKILNGLNDIKNVVRVRDFFYENGTAYMTMELLSGSTLSQFMRLNNLTCLPYQQAGEILEEVGNTLTKVHEHMLLHRDIGPNNIMMTDEGEIKLIDFGSTRVYALDSLQSMTVYVKPGFAPPEQYSRSGQGPWTDVYALAATYYFLVSGKKVPGAPDRLMGEKVKPLHLLVPGVPVSVSKAIYHALKLSSRDRPQTMRQFLYEFKSGLKEDDENLYPTMTPETQQPLKIPEQSRSGTPAVLMRYGEFRQRYGFTNRQIRIGRNPNSNHIVLADPQIGRNHCHIQYFPDKQNFLVTNLSSNKTYTSRGNIKIGESVFLARGDWICLRTSKNNVIFYMEVT